MSALALGLRQVRYENRAFWRNPPAAFFTFAFPLMFLVIFNLVFGSDDVTLFGQRVSGATFYVPAITTFAVITASYTNLSIGVTFAREQGTLKRIRGTPLPSWAWFFGRILHAVLVAALLVIIVVAFGRVFYDVEIPGHTLPAFVVSLAVGAASFCALGLAATTIIPDEQAAPAVVNAIILPLLFVSDVFIPLDDAPAWLRTFANVFPVRHFSQALLRSYFPFEKGSAFHGADLAVMAAWGLFGVAVAMKFFRWEPRR
jgi:ABC-2 type transport system permease protein